MGYSKINSEIEDKALLKCMMGLENSVIELPKVIDQTLDILSDNSALREAISESNRIALCKMCKGIAEKMISICTEEYITSIERDAEYSMKNIYYIEASKGERIATKREVESGVEGLVAKKVYPAGEKAHRMLCTIAWILTGKWQWVYKIGNKIEFSKDGKIETPVSSMIWMMANDTNEAISYIGTNEYKKARKIVAKFRKTASKVYKESAEDEVKATISKEQLVSDILNKFPKGSNEEDIRKAIAKALAYRKNPKVLKPTDIAFMREQHRVYGEHIDKYAMAEEKVEIQNIIDMCEELEKKRYSKVIDPEHFAYKIIATAKANKFERLSSKQIKIIQDAYAMIAVNAEENTGKEDSNDVDDYSGISDILEL